MSNSVLTDAIGVVGEEFAIEQANSSDLLREVFRLRHQVYCIEHQYEAGRDGLESDEFDERSRHVVLYRQRSGQVVGTVRVVLADPADPRRVLPIQQLCDPALLRHLPIATTGEVSRFAISKHWLAASGMSVGLTRIGLIRGVIQISGELALTNWCAVMKRGLFKLLEATCIHFHPIGPVIEHHGLRQPSGADIETVLSRARREQFDVWDFITEGGTFWQSASPQRIAA